MLFALQVILQQKWKKYVQLLVAMESRKKTLIQNLCGEQKQTLVFWQLRQF